MRPEKELRRRVRQQAAVVELSQRALAGTDLSTLMDEAAVLLAQTLGVKYCRVLELLPDGDALLLRAGVGWKEGLVGQAIVEAGTDSEAGYTLLSNEPVIVDHLRTETRFRGPPLLVHHGVVSGMSVIIHGRDRPFGVLGAHTARRRTFVKNDIHFLQSVANVLATAVERKRAEETLANSETQLSAVLNTAGEGIISIDSTGTIAMVNQEIQNIWGYQRNQIIGKNVQLLMPAEYREAHTAGFERYLKTGASDLLGRRLELEGLKKDGSRFPLEIRVAETRVGEQLLLTGTVHDISERKQAAEDLRRLTARLLEVQEEDRRQVAYDIHDGLGQMLTAAAMHLEACSRYSQQAALTACEAEFDKARRCLQDAVVEMRRMVSNLGPLLLEEVRLVEASRRLLADVAERMNWQTEFQGEVNVGRLDRMAEMALYRIVQEALSNAAKHSETKKVRIAFWQDNDILLLEVRDWGTGFDANRMLAQPCHGRHVGLVGMRERAALIGAEFKIESEPGKGTKLTVTAPVAPATSPVIGRKKVEVVRMTGARKDRMPSRKGITVLIADDHPMVREGLRSMLDAEGIAIIGEAATGAEAVDRVQELNPEVVLMDVRMPDMDGLTATEIVKQESPETSVIVITSYESKDYLRRAIQVGAAGYLLKGMSRESLIEAIRLVRGGGSLIDARLLSELLKEMGVEGSRFQGAEGALEALTPREQEVLQFLVRGLTNKEIAAEMHYSVGTVKNVVQRVIEKLGVSDRTQAAVYAVRAGLNPPP